MIYHYQHGDHTYTLQLERHPDGTLTATVGDQTLRLSAHQSADGVWQLRPLQSDQPPVTAITARAGGKRYVHLTRPAQARAQTHTLTISTANARRRAKHTGGSAHIGAQMPGQVVDVYVQVGDTVTTGQLLLILEAMKMEIRVTAPRDGQVQQVFVSKGAVVEKDQTLIDITDITSTPAD